MRLVSFLSVEKMQGNKIESKHSQSNQAELSTQISKINQSKIVYTLVAIRMEIHTAAHEHESGL